MFKPLIFSLALVAALSACSKKDDAISNNSGTKPATTVDSSRDAAGNGANVYRTSTSIIGAEEPCHRSGGGCTHRSSAEAA